MSFHNINLTLAATRDLLRGGHITATELTRHYLDRIDRVESRPAIADTICKEAADKYTQPVPDEVRDLVNRALIMDMWFDISLNVGGKTPTGSVQAASVRRLVDHNGIPLEFESKSALYEAEVHGEKCYVIAVCRGDDHVNEEALGSHLKNLNGGTLKDKVDTAEEFGANLHGLINPLYSRLTDKDGVTHPVVHLWDERLMNLDQRWGVFTNACNAKWGIRFRPSEHPTVIKDARCIGNFADQSQLGVNFTPKSVRIIGGNPPEVADHFVRLLRKAVNERLKQYANDANKAGKACGAASLLYEPEYETATTRLLELSMLGEGELPHVGYQLTDMIKKHARRLDAGGRAATYLVADNTLSMFADNIRASIAGTKSQFVSMIEILSGHLQETKPRYLSVLTMPTVANTGKTAYGEIFANENNKFAGKIVALTPEELLSNEKLSLAVKKAEQPLEKNINAFVSGIRKHVLRAQKAEPDMEQLAVVLGLTELSLIYGRLKELTEANLYKLDERMGCKVTPNGFEIRVGEGQAGAEKWLRVDVVDPITEYAAKVAKLLTPALANDNAVRPAANANLERPKRAPGA